MTVKQWQKLLEVKSSVFVENSTFIMTGGTISQNTAEYGGVFVLGALNVSGNAAITENIKTNN